MQDYLNLCIIYYTYTLYATAKSPHIKNVYNEEGALKFQRTGLGEQDSIIILSLLMLLHHACAHNQINFHNTLLSNGTNQVTQHLATMQQLERRRQAH